MPTQVAACLHFARRARLLIALALLPAGFAHAAPETSLTLGDATLRTMQRNPELQVFRWRFQALDGQRYTADQAPAWSVGLDSENVLGSGDYSKFDSAEFTLSLSSVIELGGKRGQRLAVADSNYALAEAEQRAQALDLLGRVTQDFITTLVLQEKLKIASEAVRLAEENQRLVLQRVRQGAAPEAESLRAKAALSNAKMEQEALSAEYSSRKMVLATAWGGQGPDFAKLSGDLFKFDAVSDFESLYQRVAAGPTIEVYAGEARLREAELQLAQSQSVADVGWQVGVRRFEDVNESALTAGISVPLFSGTRNRGEVQSAMAARDEVQYRREASLLALRARLFEAWQAHRSSVKAVEQIRVEVLPALDKALVQTRDAYQRGRYSYIDWIAAQMELLDARFALIDAASTALLNQALIEQLTAEPLAEVQSLLPR